MEKTCIIVGAGEYGNTLDEQIEMNENDYCIAADGGLDILRQKNIVPDMILGDMDSVKSSDKIYQSDYANSKCIVLPTEKDDTDMLAAIKEGLKAGYKNFRIYGALGGRLDHTLANIQCLLYLYNRGATGILYGPDTQLMLLGSGQSLILKDIPKRYISVFAYGSEASGVSIKGLKYEVSDYALKPDFPIGVSNEFIGKEGIISVKNGKIIVCFGELLE